MATAVSKTRVSSSQGAGRFYTRGMRVKEHFRGPTRYDAIDTFAVDQVAWAEQQAMPKRSCGPVPGEPASYEGTRPEVRRLTWGLLEAGLPQPSLRAQRRLSAWLDELTPVTSVPPALSDDGEGGVFSEWLAGGDRVTIHVDRSGESVIRELRDGSWRDVSRKTLWSELRRLEALITSSKAAGSRGSGA